MNPQDWKSALFIVLFPYIIPAKELLIWLGRIRTFVQENKFCISYYQDKYKLSASAQKGNIQKEGG